MIWIVLIVLSIVSGIAGRMGGSGRYSRLWRLLGCSFIAILALCLFIPFKLSFWWVYFIIFGLHIGAFSTYWDEVFGFDNLWVSGFCVGLAMFPAIALGVVWWILLIRAIFLAIAWGLLNLYVYPIGKWNRAQVEEFCRYFVSQ